MDYLIKTTDMYLLITIGLEIKWTENAPIISPIESFGVLKKNELNEENCFKLFTIHCICKKY